jgi:predicted metal-dependent HD superfamily phosphohydrolase
MSSYTNYELILEDIKKFVVALFRNRQDDHLFYHNLQHTQSVVKAVIQIANHFQLNDSDRFTVVAAAWFHDCGYYGDISNHEEKSALIAVDFLKDCSQDEKVLNNITSCILATKLPQKPATLLESILCDADLFHLGGDSFIKKSKLLRKEVNALNISKTGKEQWRQKTVQFLKGHDYHTDYCRLLLNPGKEKNIKKLSGDDEEDLDAVLEQSTETPSGRIFTAESNENRIIRGIDTMFKITSNNHQRLSNMADSKAHIMISVNAIVISLVISLLFRQIEKYHKMMIPAILLLIINLITIVFAILATRPVLPRGEFTAEDVKTQNVNLLFFGNFYNMQLDEYMSSMAKMMNDKEFLYESLVRDVYGQGIVLGRKYKLLRTSYNVFMFGLIVSVIAFVIAALS